MYVAIKKVRLVAGDARLQSESELLMKCALSPFIVRYLGIVHNGDELWVGSEDGVNGIDCHGVLSFRIPRRAPKRRKSFQ